MAPVTYIWLHVAHPPAMQGALIPKALSQCRLSVSVEDLDWDSAGCQDRLKELGALASDYIIAADCLYIDEASDPSQFLAPIHIIHAQSFSSWMQVSYRPLSPYSMCQHSAQDWLGSSYQPGNRGLV